MTVPNSTAPGVFEVRLSPLSKFLQNYQVSQSLMVVRYVLKVEGVVTGVVQSEPSLVAVIILIPSR
jgi:hypothetical protein